RTQRPSLVLEPLGGPLDLKSHLDRIHGQYFSDLPRPDITWGRSRTRLPRRQVRFATYRPRPRPLVTVSPRLDQPWIARLFIDFVLYHELCHHAQANAPMRGERVHGKRFRTWERRFPGFDQATRWERENLDRFLG
ncbi:MAG: hypothetical protein H0W83_18295, partial [Planctomycetes bacterium]|nr:hypothetical protein [Planctomycetota bacterium]